MEGEERTNNDSCIGERMLHEERANVLSREACGAKKALWRDRRGRSDTI
jgi:hypothetical protein